MNKNTFENDPGTTAITSFEVILNVLEAFFVHNEKFEVLMNVFKHFPNLRIYSIKIVIATKMDVENTTLLDSHIQAC